MSILRVLVNGKDASDMQLDAYMDRLVPSDQEQLREVMTLAAYRCKAFFMSQGEGELKVAVGDNSVNEVSMKIKFIITNPVGGCHFEFGNSFFTHGRFGEASNWFPCVNNVAVRVPFAIQVTCPKNLSVIASGQMDGVMETRDGNAVSAFQTKEWCAAHEIFIAVGPFLKIEDPTRKSLSHFCLDVRQEKMLSATNKVTAHIFSFFETLLKAPCPVDSFSTIFVPRAHAMSATYHGGVIFSDFLLYQEDIIDQEVDTTYEIAAAVAEQWVSAYIQVENWNDMWIQHGVSHMLAFLYLRTGLGLNIEKWRRLEETDRLLNDMPLEVVARPLREQDLGHAAEAFSPYVVKKSALIMLMLERRIGVNGFENKVLPALFKEKRRYNTSSFLEKLQEHSHHIMEDIENYWINGGGFPVLNCGFLWNQKRHYLEFAIKQDFKLGRFSGMLPVKVCEMDGDFQHEIIFSDEKQYAWDDFPVRARPATKKKKRAKKAAANAEGESQPTESQDSQKPKSTLVEEDKEVCPIHYLRIDPEEKWIVKYTFYQPEEMWFNMLDLSRDILAEAQAVRALQIYRSVNSIERLTAVLNDPDTFFRNRMEAARSLAVLSDSNTEWKAAAALETFIKDTLYDEETGVLKSNNFENRSDYYVCKAVIEALSMVLDDEGNTYGKTAEFLLDILTNNDNTSNKYSDYSYLYTVLIAVSKLRTNNEEIKEKIATQVERYRKLAEVIPSYHGAVSLGILRCQLQDVMSKENVGMEDLKPFITVLFSKEKMYSIRATAGDCYFRATVGKLGESDKAKVFNEILDIIMDPSEERLLQTSLLTRLTAFIRHLNRQNMGTEEKLFSSPGNSEHIKIMNRLWSLCCDLPSAFDESLRSEATTLYSTIWGLEFPACVAQVPQGLILASRVAPKDKEQRLNRSESRLNQSSLSWRDALGASPSFLPKMESMQPDPKKLKTEKE